MRLTFDNNRRVLGMISYVIRGWRLYIDSLLCCLQTSRRLYVVLVLLYSPRMNAGIYHHAHLVPIPTKTKTILQGPKSMREAQVQNSEDPDVKEKESNDGKEGQPDLPSHSCLLRHQKHPVHCTSQTYSSAIKGIVHLIRKGRRVADLVANSYRHLAMLS